VNGCLEAKFRACVCVYVYIYMYVCVWIAFFELDEFLRQDKSKMN